MVYKNRISKAVIWLLVLVMTLSSTVMTAGAATYIDCPYTTLEGESGWLSDHQGKIRVLLYGRIGACRNTNGGLDVLSRLSKEADPSKFAFFVFDVDQPLDSVQEYLREHPAEKLKVCAGSERYNRDMWSHWRAAGGAGDMVTLPIVAVVDGQGTYRFLSQGPLGGNLADLIASLAELGGDRFLDEEAIADLVPAYRHNVEQAGLRSSTPQGLEYLLRYADCRLRSTTEPIAALCGEITAGLTSDYDRLQAIHDWVAGHVYYDYEYYYDTAAWTPLDPLEVLEERRTVCQGYADLTASLCAAAGIPCRVVTGYADDAGLNELIVEGFGINHAWNEAYVDGRWVILDTTWDSGNIYRNGAYVDGATTQTYFDPELFDFSVTHKTVFCDSHRYLPETPDHLTAETSSRAIRLSFDLPEFSYASAGLVRLWRCDTADGEYQPVSDPVESAEQWIDDTVEPGKTYYYKLQYGHLVIGSDGIFSLFGELSEPVSATAKTAMGDVNDDFAINASDALLVLQHTVSLCTLEGDVFLCADVSGDGTVDASDALRILQYTVGLISSFA